MVREYITPTTQDDSGYVSFGSQMANFLGSKEPVPPLPMYSDVDMPTAMT